LEQAIGITKGGRNSKYFSALCLVAAVAFWL
jgi:hypothetical protein